MAPLHELLERYRLAFSLANDGMTRLVRNLSVDPHWIDGSDVFRYRREPEHGHEFMRVDAATAAIEPAFDHARIAALLAAATRSASRASAFSGSNSPADSTCFR